MMKKVLMLLVGLLFVFGVAFGSVTAELELTGVVQPFLSITNDPQEFIWDTGTDGYTWTGSTIFVERSNKFAGYTVDVAPSDDDWGLHRDGDTFVIMYTFTYGGVQHVPATETATSITVTTDGERTTGQGVEKEMAITVYIPEDAPEGDYSQNLTFIISSK